MDTITVWINRKSYKVQIAETFLQRAIGLMFRKKFEPYSGMLFIYQKEGPCEIWMRNMHLNLDILWVNSEWEVISIVTSAKPGKMQYSSNPPKARYVLELKEGTVQRDKIALGDVLSLSL